MAQHAGVIEHDDAGAADLGAGALDVGVARQVVRGIVDRGVVDAVKRGRGPRELAAAHGVPALRRAVLHIVLVQGLQVGSVSPAQVGVFVVVALDVERLAAAAPLGHAVVDEMAQSLLFVAFCPGGNIFVML